jgi:predicted MFS family arabinose efflux permease
MDGRAKLNRPFAFLWLGSSSERELLYAGAVIKGRYAILALLTGLNMINYLDRYVVTTVGPRIQESLGLDDTRLGWVLSAFMVGYMITSPLFGWLGDRYPRKGLIAAGVLMWSAATALSGLAQSIAPLLAARVAVGIGEASYATLGPTIIDDISEKTSKNRFFGVFYTAIPVGSALGFIIGGMLEVRYGWRTAFYVAGLPGVALALVTLLIQEPPRVTHDSAASVASELPIGGGAGVYKKLARNRLYVLTVAGYIAQTFALGGFTSWAAPFLYRKLCMELHVAAYAFGVTTVITGFVGTALGGWLADYWKGEDRVRVSLRICGWSSLIAAPLGLAALLMPTVTGAIIALGVCEIAVFASVAPTNVAVLHSVPMGVRANAMAASIFAIHLLGDLISPSAIGMVSDAVGDKRGYCEGAAGLQMGMYLLPAALFVSALFWFRGSVGARPDEGAKAEAFATQSPK